MDPERGPSGSRPVKGPAFRFHSIFRVPLNDGRRVTGAAVGLDMQAIHAGDPSKGLRAEGIGVNVHYRPVHLHSFYRRRFGTTPGLCPVAERAYERMLTLPMFPAMTDEDAADVVAAMQKVCEAFAR